MGACAAMCMCVDMPTCMCSIVRVCVCATAYVCVYAYVRLRNLQERIETGPAQILANAAGRELGVRAAVGAEDEVRGACPGDHRIHLPRREIVSQMPLTSSWTGEQAHRMAPSPETSPSSSSPYSSSP